MKVRNLQTSLKKLKNKKNELTVSFKVTNKIQYYQEIMII